MKILSVVGARPNFMKVAPFIKAIKDHNKNNNAALINHLLVHTGQHYDDRMSKSFFETLQIPEADVNLGIGSGSHAEQVGLSMIELEKVFIKEKPDWVVVFGDVNATMAAAVSAKKLFIKVCHVEAGLRSGDMRMPEEINRLVTDRLSDLLLTPDILSGQNLLNEGVPKERICFTGNIMIDTLEANRERARKLSLEKIVRDNFLETPITNYTGLYGVITLHRPSNVDRKDILENIVKFLCDEVCKDMQLFWPIHPRTLNRIKDFGLFEQIKATSNLHLLQPLGYLEMLHLNMSAKIMLTDSGGLQEECTVLGTPCLTLRWNTERPITLKENGGASVLVGNAIEEIRKAYQCAICEERKPIRPELWDGKTAERCLQAILNS